jgi:hypothetical protein
LKSKAAIDARLKKQEEKLRYEADKWQRNFDEELRKHDKVLRKISYINYLQILNVFFSKIKNKKFSSEMWELLYVLQ